MRRTAVVLLSCLALAGCSAAPDQPATPAITMTAEPTSGVSLRHLGLTHEQAGSLWLPDATTLTYIAEQPNLILVTGLGAQGPRVGEYLLQTLPGLGWTVTEEAADGILFSRGEWQGAFAVGTGGSQWSLTIRND